MLPSAHLHQGGRGCLRDDASVGAGGQGARGDCLALSCRALTAAVGRLRAGGQGALSLMWEGGGRACVKPQLRAESSITRHMCIHTNVR